MNTVETSKDVQIIERFDDMDLTPNVLKGIFSYGFETPSNIQKKCIVPFKKGRDIIAQSQSGTGKTATFSIGMLERIDPKNESLQAIILAPTRELAKQIKEVVCSLSRYTDYKVSLMIGGVKRSRYEHFDEEKYQILVGTPGRISENIKKQRIKTQDVITLIMDEADEMLSFGFRDQLVEILRGIPESSQIGLFSATMPPEMLNITDKFMKTPLRILVKTEELTLEGIKQYYVAVDKEEYKFDCLCDLYSTLSVTQTIIYANRKETVEWLAKNLTEKNFTVACITGNLSDEERTEIMKNFRSNGSRVLISTDLLARGIDIQQVSLVVNYDVPLEKTTYLHRIGRSGRFGRKGIAINLITPFDYKKFREIIDYFVTQCDELPENISL